MMGKKSLAAIRADVVEEFAKSNTDAKTWFTERIRLLKKKSANPRDIETLNLLREALQAAEEEGALTRGL